MLSPAATALTHPKTPITCTLSQAQMPIQVETRQSPVVNQQQLQPNDQIDLNDREAVFEELQ